MGRAPCCDKANVKKGPWSSEEDAMLKAYIEKHGTVGNWIALPRNIGLKRCGKSCRLRWLNYLRPNIKHGDFSEEEDRIICNLYVSIGSRWSIIAAQLPGRTDNDVKNYWNTKLKKKLLGRRNEVPIVEQDLDSSQTLTASALERLQLHLQLQGQLSKYNNMVGILPKASETRDPQEAVCEDTVGFPNSSPSSSFLMDKEFYELVHGKEGMGWWKESGFTVKASSVSSDSYSNLWSDSTIWDWQ